MTVLAGRYELLEQVGEGGMSVVWRARDLKLERDVAIKLLHSFVAKDGDHLRRFQREARTLAGLAHEHIVRVYDFATSGEQSFLVMEYVAGTNLARATRERLPLSPAEAAAYARPVAEALAYAHAQGVVHRDLTPSNILVELASGRVVTTDFGLARAARSTGSLTATGVLLGTPEFWSPEQALGRESGTAADMYALGCILYLLLSGHLPFEGDDRLALGLRRAHEAAPSLRTRLPDGPPSLVRLVDSLLEHDPERRPDASGAAAVLGESQPTTRPAESPTLVLPSEKPTTFLAPPPKSGRRVLAALLAATAVVVAALVFAGELREPLASVPNVITLREDAARAQIRRSLPTATVSVQRVYSSRVAAGRVIRQRPLPRTQLAGSTQVRLVVSRGTPYAYVPVLAGSRAAPARTALARQGFNSRYVLTPSWTIRKGAVVGLQPRAGTFLRRPATVTILVASGYPRSVVPDVRSADLATAESRLESTRLRYRLVYRLTDAAAPGQVIGQIPAAGISVYQGTQVRLTVARTLRWVKVFAASGADPFDSDVFTVPDRWRIRYRLVAGELGIALARLSWTRDGDFSGTGSFVASGTADALRTYGVGDGAGSFRISVSPYAGTHWYVEVDALR
ncbi:MAG: PASTA domain-containing protein [Actinobacteria bacterium]|nr:MAG: PASTA domain-containing protein [Actinomycetota bacterium]